MSYCYFLFIFSWYVKPKLISEKFEAIFVKHFLPWNLTASKCCSSQIGPETPQKILRGAFSMPKSNSKHTRKWWDSFLLFWLGANRLPLTCEPGRYMLIFNATVAFFCWNCKKRYFLKSNYIYLFYFYFWYLLEFPFTLDSAKMQPYYFKRQHKES